MIGKTYLERGKPVTVLVRWGKGGGLRNVLIERADGEQVVRPFRGLRAPKSSDPMVPSPPWPTEGEAWLSRREALWAVRALPETPLPLFAAADARDGLLRPELAEPAVTLAPMTAGREVAEDYRATSLSLREHPLAFLRADLGRTGHVGCADLARVRNGGRVEVAGLVLMRQKPGSAKGTMFITLEDEGGVANLILWPQVFERQRGLVLSAGLLSCRGRVQHQGRVTHVVAEHLTDLTFWLRRIGDLDLGRLPTGRGDGTRHGGGPDPRDRPSERAEATVGGRPRDIFSPDMRVDGTGLREGGETAPAIRVRSRDFR